MGYMIWNIIPSQFLESQNCQKPSLYNFTERTPIDPFGAILKLVHFRFGRSLVQIGPINLLVKRDHRNN